MRWSISAHNTFRRCQRQYFFDQVMASHNARDGRRREAYILKQLRGLKAWQGTLIHKGIQHFVVPRLEAGEPLDIPCIINETIGMGRQQLAFSEGRGYRDPANTKTRAGLTYAALYEHEYIGEIAPSDLEQVWTTVDTCLHNLANQTKLIETISRSRWIKAEAPLSFEVDGITVSVILDLLFFDNNRPFIIDWKVSDSQASSYDRQSRVYGLAVLRKWPEFPPQEVQIREVNLLRNIVTAHPLTEQDLLQTEDFIFRSASEMIALIGDRAYEEQQFEDYEPARTHRTCLYCKYRSLCLEMSNEVSTTESIRNPQLGGTQLSLPFAQDHRPAGRGTF